MNTYALLRKAALPPRHHHIHPGAYTFARALHEAHPGGITAAWAELTGLTKAHLPPRQASPYVNPVQRDMHRLATGMDYPGADAPPQMLPQILGRLRTARKQIRSVMGEARVHVAVPHDVLPELLSSGRFKSQFETHTSGGTLNRYVREEVEQSLFGYPHNLDPTKRPIYGFLARPHDVTGWDAHEQSPEQGPVHAMSLLDYGGAVVRLKRSVEDRTTATLGDSLSKLWQPTPMRNPWPTALMPRHVGRFGTPEEAMEHVPYVEAQIHGGVSLSDAEHIHFAQPHLPAKKMTRFQGQLFDKHGISSSVPAFTKEHLGYSDYGVKG